MKLDDLILHTTDRTNWAAKFFNFDIDGFNELMKKKSETFWQKVGQVQALKLFHDVSKHVPAYKDFLRRNRIDPNKIKNYEDFVNLPLTDKKNYIEAYPIQDRTWSRKISDSNLVAVSSGTSGEPKFWPRDSYQEFEAAIVHELIYKNSFQIDRSSTLLIIGFPMGVYVSGMATVLSSWLVAQKYYQLSIATVGNNKTEMLRIVKELGNQYQQIILVGHPFFIKDVIETGKNQGLKWQKIKLRLMFCSQGFNEDWRDYILNLIGSKDPEDAISVYGSSEFLLMGYETKLSLAIRRAIAKSPKLLNQVFSSDVLPDIFQYNPLLRFIENINKDLVFTSNSGIPLVRFNLHDQGIILSQKDLPESLQKVKMKVKNNWQLPFLALWGRSDQTLKFYAANIYPEHVQMGLQKPGLLKRLTGKFVMKKGEYKNLDEYLEINVELNNKVVPNKKLTKILQDEIVKKLTAVNMEYRFLTSHLEKDIVPKIKLWPYQSETFFKPGLKPRYILKT